METDVRYTLVGLFVVVLGAALLAAVAWLTARTDTRQYDYYRVYVTDSVAGLNRNAPVKFRGVDVGNVESIRLDPGDPERIALVLRIERGTPIRTNTVATLKMQGLTGLAYIELRGVGDAGIPLQIRSTDTMPEIQSSPSLTTRLDETFQNVSQQLDRLLSDANQTAVTQLLSNLQVISQALARYTDQGDQILADIRAVTGTLAAQRSRIEQIVQRTADTLEQVAFASRRLKPLLVHAETALQDVPTVLKQTERTLRSLDPVVKQAQTTLAATTATAHSLTQTSDTLRTQVQTSLVELQRFTRATTPELALLLTDLTRLIHQVERLTQLLEQAPRAWLWGRPRTPPGPGEGDPP